MTGLLNLFGLSQDAAQSTLGSIRISTENLLSSQDVNYIKRKNTPEIEVSNGRIIGINMGDVVRQVNDNLVRSKIFQQSTVNFNKVTKEFLEDLSDMQGTMDTDESLSHKLQTIFEQLSNLSGDFSSPIFKFNLLNSFKDFLGTLQSMVNEVSEQRNLIESNLQSSIGQVNDLCQKLSELNIEIEKAAYINQDTSILKTQQENIVEELAKLMDLQFRRSDNKVFVYTSSSKPLVEEKVYPLNYVSSGVLSYSNKYPTNINPINITNYDGSFTDITSDFKQGSIGACLNLRDNVLPGYQGSFDAFATVFQKQMNHVHNQGTCFPGVNSFTGVNNITNTDQSIDWVSNSTVRIAVLDLNGRLTPVTGTSTAYMDLNLNPNGTGLTTNEIVSAINQQFGTTIATLNNGYLSLTAPTGLRIAIGSVDNTPLGETTDGIGFSEYFGLNNLFVSTPDAQGNGSANTLSLAPAILANPSQLAVAKLNSSASINLTGSITDLTAIPSGDSSNLDNILSLINTNDITFPSTGQMAAQTQSFLDYISDIVDVLDLDTFAAVDTYTFSTNVLNDLEKRISMISGVNQDEELQDILQKKFFYQGILNTTKHLMDMMEELLNLFAR